MQLADSPSKKIEAKYLQSVQRRVYTVRKQLMKKLLNGAEIDDSFGALTALCERNYWRELVRKHNDPDDSFHLRLFYFVVIGSELIAELDIVRINFSSPWMLANPLRTIAASWGFSAHLQQVGVSSSMPVPLLSFFDEVLTSSSSG
jgi:hypothetical protein